MKPIRIKGDLHEDERGLLRFVNDLDMKHIRRFYTIRHKVTSTIRAWQGHRHESKWFFVIKGAFEVVVIKPDNWEQPSTDLPRERFNLSEEATEVLIIPAGHINGFKASRPDSEMMVFSDKSLQESKRDDYRFPLKYWDFK